MQELYRMASEHPLVVTGIACAVLLIIYFLFRKLVKLALILILVMIAVWAYFHFQKPEQRPASFKEALEQVRDGADSFVEKGKRAYEGGRELLETGKEGVEKGKELLDKGKAVLEKGIDKGKKTVDRGKDAAGELGKRLGGEKKADL